MARRVAEGVPTVPTPSLCRYFEKALELPGTGLKRWRDKPPALSTGELTSALYNIACCRSQLGDIENGLIAMSGAVEQGGGALHARACIVCCVPC